MPKNNLAAAQRVEIEKEFGMPLRDLVCAMHYEDRVPLIHIAGALGFPNSTLRFWFKKEWGLKPEICGMDKIVPTSATTRRAHDLGYESLSAAIADMRFSGKRLVEIARDLHCARETIVRHQPKHARGLRHISESGRQVMRKTGMRNLPKCTIGHPWASNVKDGRHFLAPRDTDSEKGD